MNGSKPTQQINNSLWIQAESKQHVNNRLKRQNKVTEAHYHSILKTVKEQFMPLHPETAFERDYKLHPDELIRAMHLFTTKGFYWYLTCGECYDYNISYAFNNCPFEAEIKALIETFESNILISEYKPQADLSQTFKWLSRMEDSVFFTTAW